MELAKITNGSMVTPDVEEFAEVLLQLLGLTSRLKLVEDQPLLHHHQGMITVMHAPQRVMMTVMELVTADGPGLPMTQLNGPRRTLTADANQVKISEISSCFFCNELSIKYTLRTLIS